MIPLTSCDVFFFLWIYLFFLFVLEARKTEFTSTPQSTVLANSTDLGFLFVWTSSPTFAEALLSERKLLTYIYWY